MNFKPINKRVLVKRLEAEPAKKGSLVLVAGDKEKSKRATVIAISDDITEIKPGDVIFMDRYGQEITIEEDTYILLRIEEVVGVFNERVL